MASSSASQLSTLIEISRPLKESDFSLKHPARATSMPIKLFRVLNSFGSGKVNDWRVRENFDGCDTFAQQHQHHGDSSMKRYCCYLTVATSVLKLWCQRSISIWGILWKRGGKSTPRIFVSTAVISRRATAFDVDFSWITSSPTASV